MQQDKFNDPTKDNPFVNREQFDPIVRKRVACQMAARKVMDVWYLSLPKGPKEQVEELAAAGRFDVIWDLYSGTPGFPAHQIEALTEIMNADVNTK